MPSAQSTVAIRADHLGGGPAGVIARVEPSVVVPLRSDRVSDASWKVFAGAGGPPPDDAAGEPWYSPWYDDSAWQAATVVAAYGGGSWGATPGLWVVRDASWIWVSDQAAGSTVYLRSNPFGMRVGALGR